MQDLKYFVDIVESVHSGGASLFGLKTAQISQFLLHLYEKHHWVGTLPSPQYHNNWFHPTWPVTALPFNLRHNLYPNLIALMTLIYPNKLHLVQSSQVIVCLPRPHSSWAYIHNGIQIFETLQPFSRSYFVVVNVVVVNNIFFTLAAGFQSFRQTQS